MKKKIFLVFVLWRLFLFIPLFLGSKLIPYREGYEFTNILSINPLFSSSSLIFPWANFDGVRYLSIASRGYNTEAAFFPLYPFLIHFFSNIFRNSAPFGVVYFFIALLISNFCFLLSLFVLSDLLKIDYKKKSIYWWTFAFLLAFPTSFFFVGVYAESTFLLLLFLSFLLARKRKWIYATLMASLLTISRPVGILIYPVLVYELITQNKKKIKDGRRNVKKCMEFIKKYFYLNFIPIPFVAYSIYNYKKWGDALYFIKSHGQLANSRSMDKIILFPQTIYRYLKMLFVVPLDQFEWWIVLLELFSFVLVVFLLYFAFKQKMHMSYLLFAVLSVLIPSSTGTFSGLPRYILISFPFYIVLAKLKSRLLKLISLFFFFTIQALLLIYFSRGYFVA